MARFSPKTAQVPVAVVGVSLEDTPLSDLHCHQCGRVLDFHQPEEGSPERMLGTCPHCHIWYLWDFEPDHNRGLMIVLPAAEFFRDAAKAAGI